MDVPMPTPADEWQIEMDGGVPLVPAPGAQSTRDVIPDQLLDGGNHFDDLGYRGRYNRQRRYAYLSARSNMPLPRERLHDFLVCDAGLTRPIIQQTTRQYFRQDSYRNITIFLLSFIIVNLLFDVLHFLYVEFRQIQAPMFIGIQLSYESPVLPRFID
jgi:hypothetical protein